MPHLTRHIETSRRFANSFYFYEGVRMTIGIMLPVFLGIFFRHNAWGIAAAIGALSAGITDFPGPIHHRINGIIAVTCCIFGITIITGLLNHHSLWLGIFIAIAGFMFSIISVYGNRASQIGGASLVILTLLLDENRKVESYPQLALITVVGAAMYLLLSLLLYRLRPYKLVQQVLGQCIQDTAKYLNIKAGFYEADPNFEQLYQNLTEAQVQVNASQQNVREIMFKTRRIVKESTHTSKILMLSFLDLVDLFDAAMASQPNYRLIQQQLHGTNMLQQFGTTLLQMAKELDETGQAFMEGKHYPPNPQTKAQLIRLQQHYEETRLQQLDAESIEAFISLRHALDVIEDLQQKLEQLQIYSSYSKSIPLDRKVEYQRFIVPSYFSHRLVLNNLSWRSNIFRYSLRVMTAMVAGYLLSMYTPLGHAYWVMLTIVVILKPAYAITRKRNTDRLLGTLLGVIIGAAILFITNNTAILLCIMLAFMIQTFSFWRHRYFYSVLTLTVYIVIAMHLLQPGNFTTLLKDRLIDTFIGSVIALVLTIVIPPVWDTLQISNLAAKTIAACRTYFEYVSRYFTGEQVVVSDYKLHRKNLFVDLANFSDAFQRMSNEPKMVRENAPEWQQLLVSCHVLASHIAALYNEAQEISNWEQMDDFVPLTKQISNRLQKAGEYLGQSAKSKLEGAATGNEDIAIRNQVNELLQQRRRELNRGEWETETKNDLIQLKSLLDQLEMMLQLSGDIRRVCRSISN